MFISGSFEWKGSWTRCFHPSWLYTAGMTFKVTLWSAWQLSTIVIEQEFLHLCTFEWMIFLFFFQFWNFHLEIFPSFTKFLFILAGISDTFCHKEIHEKNEKGIFFTNYTMRTNLLNWCNLVSISKNVVFYAFGVVRIY